MASISALVAFKDQVRKDSVFAWSFLFNMAMSYLDAYAPQEKTPELEERAYRGAAVFMEMILHCEIKQHPKWKGLEELWSTRSKVALQEEMVPVATYDGVEFTRYTLSWLNGAMPEGTMLYAPASEVKAKRLTTAQMLASIPTAEEIQASNAAPVVEEALAPLEDTQPEGDHALARPGTEGREEA